MFKRGIALGLSLVMVLGLIGCSSAPKPATPEAAPAETTQEAKKFHIGIVTGTVSQGEDELRGAEAMIAKYGNSADGGMITHVTYPDNFMQEQETTIAQIVGLADDPDMKVIVVNQAIPGTVAAFQQIREKNPDILLLANSSQEDTAMIEAAADMVVDPDNVNRGYLMILALRKWAQKHSYIFLSQDT